jgi:hypothetical protein
VSGLACPTFSAAMEQKISACTRGANRPPSKVRAALGLQHQTTIDRDHVQLETHWTLECVLGWAERTGIAVRGKALVSRYELLPRAV